MKRRLPFTIFAILTFLIALIPVFLILINLSGIISTKLAFFGGNPLVLVVLIPIVCGIFLFLGIVIITKKEEKITLAAHERMKKSSQGFSGEKELEDISVLIETMKGSLEHIQRASRDIVVLSKKMKNLTASLDQTYLPVSSPEKKYLAPVLSMPPTADRFIPFSKVINFPEPAPGYRRRLSAAHINEPSPYREPVHGPFAQNKNSGSKKTPPPSSSAAPPETNRVLGKTLTAEQINQAMEYKTFKTGTVETEVLYMLFKQLKIEQSFHR